MKDNKNVFIKIALSLCAVVMCFIIGIGGAKAYSSEGTKSLTEISGITASQVQNQINANSENYYNTPWVGYSVSNPCPRCTAGDSSCTIGMNCAGFVYDVLANLGWKPLGSGDDVCKADHWFSYFTTNGVKRYYFTDTSDFKSFIDSGEYSPKYGDVIYFPLCKQDTHIGFYWGDPNSTWNWMVSSNSITNSIAGTELVSKDGNCPFYLIPFGSPTPPVEAGITVRKYKYVDGNKTEEFVGGAEFTLYNTNGSGSCDPVGSVIEKKTSTTSGPITFSGLEDGKYYCLAETKLPDGFIFPSINPHIQGPEKVMAGNPATDFMVTYYNEPRGKFYVVKCDADNCPYYDEGNDKTDAGKDATTWLEGAQFELYESESSQRPVQTCTEGTKTISGAPYSYLNGTKGCIFDDIIIGKTYYLRESVCPTGYTCDTTTRYEVVMTDSYHYLSEWAGIKTVKNEPESTPSGFKFTIIKKDADDGTRLAGAVFELYESDGTTPATDMDGNTITLPSTGTNGTIVVNNMAEGTYVLKEVTPPPGYEPNNLDMTFTISSTGTVSLSGTYEKATLSGSTFTILNDEIPTAASYGIRVVKKDDAGTRLAGAVFALYEEDGTTPATDKDGNAFTNQTTNASGLINYTNLEVGKYVLKEVSPPDGFEAQNLVIDVEIDGSGSTIFTEAYDTVTSSGSTVTIENKPVVVVPPKYSVRAVKTDPNGVKLAGVTFGLFAADQTTLVQELTTTQTGSVEFAGLSASTTYYIKETKGIPGYRDIIDVAKVDIDASGNIVVTETSDSISSEGAIITFVNQPIKKVVISKEDITTKKELAGATLEIRDNTGNIAKDSVTGEALNWISSYSRKEVTLAAGEYTLKETVAPGVNQDCVAKLVEGQDASLCNYKTVINELKFSVDDDGNITVLATDNKYYAVNESLITMYNESDTPVIDVPDTAAGLNIVTICVGAAIFFVGYQIVFKNKKQQAGAI